MPVVGSKHFAYTKKGIKAAASAARSVGKNVKQAVRPSTVRAGSKVTANEADADYMRDMMRKKKMKTSDGYMKMK